MASLFQATLRIRASNNDPELIDQALGRASTGFSPVILLDSQMKRQSCEDSYWKLKLGNDPRGRSFSVLLEEVVYLMGSCKEKLMLENFFIKGVDIMWMIHSESGYGGFNLESEIMGKLTKLNINLVFDIYD